MTKEKMEEIKEKSTSGSVGELLEKKFNIKTKDDLIRIGMHTLLGAMLASTLVGGGIYLANTLKNRIMATQTRCEYYSDITEGCWSVDESGWQEYHDAAIANNLMKLDENNPYGYEFDLGISSILSTYDEELTGGKYTSEEFTNEVLKSTEYGSLDNYLDAKNCNSVKEFQLEMDKEIALQSEIENKQQELAEMRNEIVDEEGKAGVK